MGKRKTEENTTHRRSALSQQVITMMQGTDKTNMKYQKDPQKKHRFGTVSKNTGGLKHVKDICYYILPTLKSVQYFAYGQFMK